jgi:hypothetical protein
MRLVLNIGKRLADTVAQMAESRNLSVECFLSQLVDAAAADFRLARYEPAAPILPLSTGDAADQSLPVAHKQLSGAVVQKLLHASQLLTVNQLSRRFNISSTNVRRILRLYERAEHHNLLAGSRAARPDASRPFRIKNVASSEQP